MLASFILMYVQSLAIWTAFGASLRNGMCRPIAAAMVVELKAVVTQQQQQPSRGENRHRTQMGVARIELA